MEFVRSGHWDGDPAFSVRGGFFYTIGRIFYWEVRIAVMKGSPLDWIFSRWAGN
jgi:hypothetical protein